MTFSNITTDAPALVEGAYHPTPNPMREASPECAYRYATLPHGVYAGTAGKQDSDLIVTTMAYLSSIAPPASNITTLVVYSNVPSANDIATGETRCLNYMVLISSWFPRCNPWFQAARLYQLIELHHVSPAAFVIAKSNRICDHLDAILSLASRPPALPSAPRFEATPPHKIPPTLTVSRQFALVATMLPVPPQYPSYEARSLLQARLRFPQTQPHHLQGLLPTSASPVHVRPPPLNQRRSASKHAAIQAMKVALSSKSRRREALALARAFVEDAPQVVAKWASYQGKEVAFTKATEETAERETIEGDLEKAKEYDSMAAIARTSWNWGFLKTRAVLVGLSRLHGN
ncbi:hypothetical protein BOTBODRAFT_192816 [Botryobasidium botryosum FD-172 SS1]|uniref:Uncharacterized protein n=1 Tax=Botryobasidium botryosum (strain FD-172 SS1) TaxID=930990 RepID=A0A067LX01_BOTB1|nr:hypothetical protein BOTBODRAFT_192816 [Botryobasidium botryosum FD-172 SS1]